MNDTDRLVVTMAEQCRILIEASEDVRSELPEVLQPKHLLWMSDRIVKHAQDWRRSKLHRWIGFIQCGMLANGILDFEGAKAMFDTAKKSHAADSSYDDLNDFLDPENAYLFDIGGEG